MEESESEESAFGIFQHNVAESQSDKDLDLREYIFLDNDSTVHAFCNRKFTSKVYNVKHTMSLTMNGGIITTNMMCDIPGLEQPVWFHTEYITNVFSLSILKSKYRITYHSHKDGAFIIHLPTKRNLKCRHHRGGLHLLRPKGQFTFCIQWIIK